MPAVGVHLQPCRKTRFAPPFPILAPPRPHPARLAATPATGGPRRFYIPFTPAGQSYTRFTPAP